MMTLAKAQQSGWRGLGQDWRIVSRLKLLENNRQRLSVLLLLALVLLMSTSALSLSLALQQKTEHWQQALAGRLSIIIPPHADISVALLDQPAISYRLFEQDFGANNAALADALDRLAALLKEVPSVAAVEWLSIDETRRLMNDWEFAEQDVWQSLGLPLLLEVQQHVDSITPRTQDDIRALITRANPNAVIDDQGRWGEEIQRANNQLLFLLYGLNGFLIITLLLISVMITRIDLWQMDDKLKVLWLLGATERVILILMMRRGLRILWVGAICSLGTFVLLQALLEGAFLLWFTRPNITLLGAPVLGNSWVWQGVMIQYALLILASAVTNVLASRYYWKQ